MAADPQPWPFAAGGEITEQLDWLTDVLQAATGPDQTRRLRQDPRITLSWSGLEQGGARRWLETLLHARGATGWLAPLHTDALALTAQLPAGSTLVPGDASALRIAAGGRALLIGATARPSEVVDVLSADAAGVALSAATTLAWSAGDRLLPLYAAHFDSLPTLSRFTADVVQYDVELVLDAPPPVDAADDLPMYRDIPVLEFRADWKDDPTWQPARDTVTVDMDIGPVLVADLIGLPRTAWAASITAQGRAAIVALYRLLYRLAGRWQPIWLPSQGADLAPVSGITAAGTTLDVGWCGLTAAGVQPTRRDLRIELSDGTVLYRRVTAIATIGVDAERLTVDSAWGVTATAAQIVLVGWLLLGRQSSDVNKLTWWSGDVVRTHLDFTGVADDGI